VRDGSWFTCTYTGWGTLTVTGLARSATIPDLLALLGSRTGYQFLVKGIKLILTHLEHVCRAGLYTIAASSALICVNNYEPVARTVFKTVLRYHFLAFLSFPCTFHISLLTIASPKRAAPRAPAIWVSKGIELYSGLGHTFSAVLIPNSFSSLFTTPSFLAIPPVITNFSLTPKR
jgi:hypothetical protein